MAARRPPPRPAPGRQTLGQATGGKPPRVAAPPRPAAPRAPAPRAAAPPKNPTAPRITNRPPPGAPKGPGLGLGLGLNRKQQQNFQAAVQSGTGGSYLGMHPGIQKRMSGIGSQSGQQTRIQNFMGTGQSQRQPRTPQPPTRGQAGGNMLGKFQRPPAMPLGALPHPAIQQMGVNSGMQSVLQDKMNQAGAQMPPGGYAPMQRPQPGGYQPMGSPYGGGGMNTQAAQMGGMRPQPYQSGLMGQMGGQMGGYSGDNAGQQANLAQQAGGMGNFQNYLQGMRQQEQQYPGSTMMAGGNMGSYLTGFGQGGGGMGGYGGQMPGMTRGPMTTGMGGMQGGYGMAGGSMGGFGAGPQQFQRSYGQPPMQNMYGGGGGSAYQQNYQNAYNAATGNINPNDPAFSQRGAASPDMMRQISQQTQQNNAALGISPEQYARQSAYNAQHPM